MGGGLEMGGFVGDVVFVFFTQDDGWCWMYVSLMVGM